MNKAEMILGRIETVIEVADETVERAKTHGDKFSVDIAKSVAYDHIKRIFEEVED